MWEVVYIKKKEQGITLLYLDKITLASKKDKKKITDEARYINTFNV